MYAVTGTRVFTCTCIGLIGELSCTNPGYAINFSTQTKALFAAVHRGPVSERLLHGYSVSFTQEYLCMVETPPPKILK